MKLSIIVPFHRGAHFLEDCFESIRDQGISDFETVLVLDHIKEDISQILNEYKDLNIKIVKLNGNGIDKRDYGKEENITMLKGYSGVAAARNAGLDAAEGEYIYFLDSDDYILNGSLPYLLKEIEEEQADFVYGNEDVSWFKRMIYIASLDKNEQKKKEKKEATKYGNGYGDYGKISEELTNAFSNLDKNIVNQKIEAYYNLFASRKDIAGVSVLGLLLRRELIEEYKIRFNENFLFFSDLGFVVQLLNLAKTSSKVEEAVYVKRNHNDPIHFPSLRQLKTEDRFEEYMESYKEARTLAGDNYVLGNFIDYKFIDAYTTSYARKIVRDKNKLWRTERLQLIIDAIRQVDPAIINCLKGYNKRIVKDLLSGDLKKLKLHVNLHLGINKLKKISKKWRVLAYYLYEHYFIKMSVKDNWVICESFFGKSYSDSPKYIYEYLCKNYPGKYKFIWVINKRSKIPFNPIKVKRFSIRYAYYLARCKYTIFNVRQPDWVVKREGNVFLQTWHGTPLKKLVFDQEEVMTPSPLYKAQFYKQSKTWDYLVSANHFSSKVFRSAFLYDNEILEYGYPRNDLMHSLKKDIIAADIKKRLKIPQEKKIILYAPTWRDDEYYDKGKYKFTLKLDLSLLRQELGQDYMILLRTHYYIADKLDISGLEDFAINVSKYDDITELYLISDILITDYSSVFFDYANLKRPILFYTYDLDKYRDMLRGFYLDIEKDVPGPLLFTNEEVVEAIKNIDDVIASYKEKYEVFYEEYCSLEDGHASENIAKRVFNLD